MKLQVLGTVLSCSIRVRFEMYNNNQSKVQCLQTDFRFRDFLKDE